MGLYDFASGLLSMFTGGIQTQMVNSANKQINKAQLANANNMQDKAQQYTRENMAAENAEWTRRFGTENSEWQRRFDLQNAYNTPAAQRERLEASGLNPYLMMSGGSAGVSQAAIGTSSSSPAAHQGAQGSIPNLLPMQASSNRGGLFDVLTTIASSIKNIRSSRKDVSETQGIDIDNVTRLRENVAKLMNTIADTEGKKVSNNFQRMANDVMGQTLDTQVEQTKQNLALTRQQTFLAKQQGLKIKCEMQYLPQKFQAEIDSYAQQIAESKVRAAVLETQKALNKSQLTVNEAEVALKRKLAEYYNEAASREAADALYKIAQKNLIPTTPELCKKYIDQTIELRGNQIISEGSRAGFYDARSVEAYSNAANQPLRTFLDGLEQFSNGGNSDRPKSPKSPKLPKVPKLGR